MLADDPEELRAAAGLSRAKVSYLRSLAEHVVEGSLELERLDELPDEQVIAELVAVKGIGEWSAHMFLMFHLQRPDVLAVGDLGIRRAVMLAYGLDELPAPAELERIGEPWRPHRTLACLFLWQSLERDTGVDRHSAAPHLPPARPRRRCAGASTARPRRLLPPPPRGRRSRSRRRRSRSGCRP